MRTAVVFATVLIAALQAEDKCPPPVYDDVTVAYINDLNKKDAKVQADIKAQGIKYLADYNKEIGAAFDQNGCKAHGPRQPYSKADRDQLLWQFLKDFKSKGNVTFDENLLKLVKGLEDFIRFASKNQPFMQCMANKIRNGVLGEVDKCMGPKYSFKLDKLDNMSIPVLLGDAEFEANTHAYLGMQIKAVFNASKCSDPAAVVKQVYDRKYKQFCDASAVYAKKSADCQSTFGVNCPIALGCIRELIGKFDEKLKPVLLSTIKSLKDCKAPTPEGAPSMVEIVKAGIKMWQESEATLKLLKSDPKYAKINAEGRDYLRIVLSSFVNDQACECKKSSS